MRPEKKAIIFAPQPPLEVLCIFVRTFSLSLKVLDLGQSQEHIRPSFPIITSAYLYLVVAADRKPISHFFKHRPTCAQSSQPPSPPLFLRTLHTSMSSQRSKDELDPEHPNPCYPRACAIQGCLQKSGFDQSRCEYLVDDLYRCCAKFYQQRGKEAEADSCPIPSVVERRIRKMEQEGKGGAGGSLLETKKR